MGNANVFKRLAAATLQSQTLRFACFVLLILASRSAIADWNYVPTGSMKPTILEGDMILVNRLAYDLKIPFSTWRMARWETPDRGDIVVAYSPLDGVRLVKRVVAVPGDRVEIVGQSLIVNGEVPSYEHISADNMSLLTERDRNTHAFANETLLGHSRQVMYGNRRAGNGEFSDVTVPEGQYFLMGDHRNNSLDSRTFGFVDQENILGQATHVLFSYDKYQGFRFRGSRLLSQLM